MDLINKHKYHLLLLIILVLALFLRIYNLSDLMFFFPDQGIFYLSARDMLVNGNIPLVGAESSHPWIRHGPIWTYTLGIILWLFNFNPIIPAYFIAILGVFTVFVFYIVLKLIYNEKIAILGALLYATSPLIVTNSRLAYHTSPIPFFVILLFYFTYKLVNGSKWSLPVITLLLGVLYNHEIATFVYFIAIAIILGYGFFKKEKWFKKLLDIKLIFISTVAFLIPMIPFILYDVGNGQYNQTLRFLVWVGYRIAKFPLSLVSDKFVSPSSGPTTLSDFFSHYELLIFASNSLIALLILILSIIFLIVIFYKNIKIDKNKLSKIKLNLPFSHILIFIFFVISMTGLFIHKIPNEGDTLLISPFVLILTTLAIYWMVKSKFYLALVIISLIALGNMYFILSTNYRTKIDNNVIVTINKKLEAVDKIIILAENKPYSIIGKGELSDFKSFTMPYEYLLWWKGYPPSKEEIDLEIIIWEKGDEIIISPAE